MLVKILVFFSIILNFLQFINAFSKSDYPDDVVYYYSQWAIYGHANDNKGPPYNWMTATSSAPGITLKSDTAISGSFAGRYFSLQDLFDLKGKYFPPTDSKTEKIINFAFAGVDMNTCEVKLNDFFADFQVGVGGSCGGKGQYVWAKASKGEYGHACAIKSLKNDLKIHLSIGGWTMSSEFSHCTAEKMDTLVNSMTDLIKMYGFQAIDIDWEYPGRQGCGGTDDDPCKFVVGRNLKRSVDYLKTHSSPPAWIHPMNPKFGANPSYFVPISSQSTGSIDANHDNAEQCHSGDIGVVYRVCNDARLLADWYTECSQCPVSSTVLNCAIEHSESCLGKMYQDCLKYYGLGVTTHTHCQDISNIFGTPSGEEKTKEYWVNKGQSHNDWTNYVKFVRKIKEVTGLEVTAAIGMSTALIDGDLSPKNRGTSYSEFCSSLSRVNVMTYDFYGAWGPPYHNAPLFPDPKHEGKENYIGTFNVKTSVEKLIENGCPPDKINLGLALYGRSYQNAGQKFGDFGQKSSSQTTGVGTYQKGSMSFWDVNDRFLTQAQGGRCDVNPDIRSANLPESLQECGKWELKRDVTAGCVPYLEKKTSQGFDIISYDDNISIGLKAKWARCKGLKGIMFWDSADDKDGILSEAAWKAWNSVKESECDKILVAPTSCGGSSGGDDSNHDSDQPKDGGSCEKYQSCVSSCVDCIVTGQC